MRRKRYWLVELNEDNKVEFVIGMAFNRFETAVKIGIRLAMNQPEKEYGILDFEEKCYFKIDRV